MKMKNDRQPTVREGESVSLGFEPHTAHLFDADNGQRLRKTVTQ
jgi:hypothetical protein